MKGLFKKCSIYIVCMLIIFQGAASGTVAAGSSSAGDFSDIKGHWAEKTINEMISKGWINGISIDGHLQIRPNKDITRAEFIAALHRTEKIPETKEKAKKFSDVADSAWFKEALDNLAGNGLVSGYADGTFKPGNFITRAEIASILCRAGQWETSENINSISTLKMFNDIAVGKWYYNSVMINKQKGVISGYPNGTFGPMNKATRAEAFSMISRFVQQMEPNVSNPSNGDGKGSDNDGNTDTVSEPGQVGETEPVKVSDSVGFIAYNIKGNAGDKVLYQFYGYGMKNLGKFDAKISYDPAKVVAEAVVKGTLKQGDYLNADFSAADKGYITIHGDDNAKVDGDGRGVVFVVMFQVQPGTSGKTGVTLSGINGGAPELYTSDGKPFENVTVENGSITIK